MYSSTLVCVTFRNYGDLYAELCHNLSFSVNTTGFPNISRISYHLRITPLSPFPFILPGFHIPLCHLFITFPVYFTWFSHTRLPYCLCIALSSQPLYILLAFSHPLGLPVLCLFAICSVIFPTFLTFHVHRTACLLPSMSILRTSFRSLVDHTTIMSNDLYTCTRICTTTILQSVAA